MHHRENDEFLQKNVFPITRKLIVVGNFRVAEYKYKNRTERRNRNQFWGRKQCMLVVRIYDIHSSIETAKPHLWLFCPATP